MKAALAIKETVLVTFNEGISNFSVRSLLVLVEGNGTVSDKMKIYTYLVKSKYLIVLDADNRDAIAHSHFFLLVRKCIENFAVRDLSYDIL